jgi:hypothetical protein
MKARKAFEHMERAFGPIVSILMIVDVSKDIYQYLHEKVQTRRERTRKLTPAEAH